MTIQRTWHTSTNRTPQHTAPHAARCSSSINVSAQGTAPERESSAANPKPAVTITRVLPGWVMPLFDAALPAPCGAAGTTTARWLYRPGVSPGAVPGNRRHVAVGTSKIKSWLSVRPLSPTPPITNISLSDRARLMCPLRGEGGAPLRSDGFTSRHTSVTKSNTLRDGGCAGVCACVRGCACTCVGGSGTL
jgi:hypothetical protein